MNIEQLKNGCWRIRKDYKRKTYRLTIDHKPTKREAEILINTLIEEQDFNFSNMSFERAAKEYLKIKSNVLSPSTKRGYTSLMKQFSERFNKLRIYAITQADVQKEVNDYAENHSSKSTANLHGFISAVLKEYRPSLQLYTKLPQKQMNRSGYVPTREEVEQVLELLSYRHKIGIKLAICGLRRSEICALVKSDLDDNNILHINKAYVQDEEWKWHTKELNKTDASTREIKIPSDLATEIRGLNIRERIYPYNPHTLYNALIRAQNEAGVPHFKLHALRAFYASYLHSIGINDAYLQKMGGWKSDYIMKSVYRRTLDDVQKEMMDKTSECINDIFNPDNNKN